MASTNLSWSRMSQDQKQRREPKAVRPAEKKSLIVAIDQHDSIRFQVTSALSNLSSRFYVWKTVPHAFLAAYPIFGPQHIQTPHKNNRKKYRWTKNTNHFWFVMSEQKKSLNTPRAWFMTFNSATQTVVNATNSYFLCLHAKIDFREVDLTPSNKT